MIKMASYFFVVFVAVSCFLQSNVGFALDIEITPNKVNRLMHKEVHITCRLNSSDSDVREVMILEVSRYDKPIAIIRQNQKLSVPAGMETKFQAEGNTGLALTSNYIHMTLLNPKIDDDGEYTCLMYYLDGAGVLKETRRTANLTILKQTSTTMLAFLVDKVNKLEKELTSQKEEFRSKETGLQNQISQLQSRIKNQEDKLKQHEDKDQISEMFVASYNGGSTLTTGNTIRYKYVKASVGQGYSSYTGRFTAPVDGFYLFQISVSAQSDKYIYIDLKTDYGQTITRVMAGDEDDWDDYSAGIGIARLVKGEEVYPYIRRANGGFGFYSYDSYDLLNQFSGYLLKAL